MLTWENDVEAAALRKQGWTISAIARHLGRDRKTIRDYLDGKRAPGVRARSAPDPFEEFAEYARIRLVDDPHLWATTLFDEVVALGYPGSYPSFTRGLRTRRCGRTASRVRPRRVVTTRSSTTRPGPETQFDWLELPDPPAGWGWGVDRASAGRRPVALEPVAGGAGRVRGPAAPGRGPRRRRHVASAAAPRRGGSTGWPRCVTPSSGRITATFAPVAKHYGVGVDICPSRHGNRKGVVEKGNHSLAQRWWRTLADDLTPAQAQSGLDAFCVRVGDARRPHRSTGPAPPSGRWRRPSRWPRRRCCPTRPQVERGAGRLGSGAGRVPRQLLLHRPGPVRGHGHGPAPAGRAT